MIKHVLFLNLKEEAEGRNKAENAALLKEQIESLAGKIEGLLSIEVGINCNPKGWDLCLYSEFTDKEALAFYQKHPLHLAAGKFAAAVCTDARAVCDYEV